MSLPPSLGEKKMKKVDTANPFSTFDRQTSNRKRYFVPSEFAKSKWLHIRDMDADGKYMSENNNKPDLWKNVAKSDKLVRKYSGDVFADTKLDDGLYSLVDKKETNDEKDLVKSQSLWQHWPPLTQSSRGVRRGVQED